METVSDDQPETPPQHKEEEKHNEKQVQEEEEEEEQQSFPETPSPLFQSPYPPSGSPTPSSTHQTFHAYELRVAPADTKPEMESVGRIGGGSDANVRTLRPKLSILKRSRRESVVRRALFGLRISGFVLCLISFSIMAADKNQGWALDSLYRYKEFSYLLMSASSSAAIRVDDWESNWGKDKFPDMARASVALSFLAFVAFASSSLISGYTLCTLKSM
ncbi:unnamed protein product [Malus baccata var. baccata]